ncbi:MAG: HEAT repeat domain-containing protein [Rhodothermales bacterium]|nr:HEAT repeat domain-containing protein [Rhodothermales bacterium]
MTRTTMLLALTLLLAPAAFAIPADDPDEAVEALRQAEVEAVSAARWDAFGDRLVQALRDDHDGVRVAAMQLVIRYGDQVDVRRAVNDVLHLYREHDDDDVRRMAVVALGQMNSGRAIGVLRLSEDFEKNEAVQRTIRAVLAAHEAARQDA